MAVVLRLGVHRRGRGRVCAATAAPAVGRPGALLGGRAAGAAPARRPIAPRGERDGERRERAGRRAGAGARLWPGLR